MKCSFVPNDYLEDSEFVEYLGSGGYGTVHLVRVSSNEYYAVKYINVYEDGVNDDVIKEVDSLILLRSVPEVVQFKGVDQRTNRIAIIMEPMEMNLCKYISTTPSDEIKRMFDKLCVSMMRAAYAFQEAKMVHLDIKPTNVLVKDGYFKLADFGTSSRGADNLQPPNILTSLSYKPPEVIFERELMTYPLYAIDMWSIGLVLVEYIREIFPTFNGESVDEIGVKIHNNSSRSIIPYGMFAAVNKTGMVEGKIAIDISDKLDTKYINVINGLLELNPEDRPTAKEVLQYLEEPLPDYPLHKPKEERAVDNDINKMFTLLKALVKSRHTILMAIDIYTRYLGIAQAEKHPLAYLAITRLVCDYNFPAGELISEILSEYNRFYREPVTVEQIKCAEEDVLNKLNFQFFHDGIIAAFKEMYYKQIDLGDLLLVPIEEYTKPILEWFK